jgi:cholesterol oxidase
MYDYVVIGSGFGGAVSALRLSEKGYKVLVIEKGKWFHADDFPNTNWNLRKWLWMPKLKCFGIQKLTFLRHITVLSGTGVGGGSLVYANTLPKPNKAYYQNGSWAGLADWEKELDPFYDLAWEMLGATENPSLGQSDRDFRDLARNLGIEDKFKPTKVAVYFGKEGEIASDPYFNGEGPSKTGCIKCGACMTGCKHNAKNTLDTNYLFIAQKNGAEILAEKEVVDVIPLDDMGTEGYEVVYNSSVKYFSKRNIVKTKGIVFAGGVLGTVPLLLKLKKKRLPLLSDRTGDFVRTNNEALIGNISFNKNRDMTEGIAIGSIIDLDENTHIEPVRYGNKSGFWRLLLMPMVTETNFFIRFLKLITSPFREFKSLIKTMGIRDFAKQTSIILFMQHLDSTLKLKLGWFGLSSNAGTGKTPTAFIPEAHKVARTYAKQINGVNRVLGTETLTGIPTTAHILGGAVIGNDKETGVIDKNNKVFDYHNMYVCDGSMISANPGVNPSLGITALAERAMSKIPHKNEI